MPVNIIWSMLEKVKVTRVTKKLIKDMYDNAMTLVRSPVGKTTDISITKG